MDVNEGSSLKGHSVESNDITVSVGGHTETVRVRTAQNETGEMSNLNFVW